MVDLPQSCDGCLVGIMNRSRIDHLVARLRDLQGSAKDIEASALVSVDGLIIASSLPPGVEEDRISAMSAAMHSLGERISSELGRGTLDQVSIRGNSGHVLLMSVGPVSYTHLTLPTTPDV